MKSCALCVLLLAVSAWAGGVEVLESIVPLPSKKMPQGYSLEGEIWHYRDANLDVKVTPLTPEARARYYAEKQLEDPFSGVLPRENLVVMRLRVENLQKDGTVEFSPTACMLGNSLAFDDTYVYQFLYKEKNADAKLASAGKTLFMKHLSLPAGTWIEHLLAFQYDDPYPTKKLGLILGGISAGAEGVDIVFPFKATFKKEKGP